MSTPGPLTLWPALCLWLALLLPLAAAGGITLFTLRDRGASARLSIGAVLAAFGLSATLFATGARGETALTWLAVEAGGVSLQVDFGLGLDPLSSLMLLVVTGVGGVIHVYSYGYMREDRSVGRYFAGLSLFTFAMVGIVLANNFLLLFIFWELVGLSSYLLIGFWYERPAAADACKKAFLTNRLGDYGFLLGILTVWAALGSVNFHEQERTLAASPQALGTLATAAGLLIFCGTIGKSAQFPLHVWLPDAMEGPTPVSALIHAATMVAAGVFMLCRVFYLLAARGSWALEVIAWLGATTALLAALMALQQNDIKRILAYSTISQLGYMVMAVGLSHQSNNPAPAMYHLTTHAFFKALLFLGAGSVIHALHEQDIWKMGGLRRKMPVTFWTFVVATLALCGVPPLSGFYSKDEILAAAWRHNLALFIVAVLVASLTAFYMFRLLLVAFGGPVKSHAPDRAHESPAVMTLPLLVLAVATALGGFWGIDQLYAQQFEPLRRLEPVAWPNQLLAPFHHAFVAAGLGLAATLAGLAAAWASYRHRVQDPLPGRLGAAARGLRNCFYFDELYRRLIALTQEATARLADALDRWIIAGLLVRGTHGAVELAGRLLRLAQTGNLQTYALWFVAGLALILYFMLGE
jgi:NADH-quinone oxidoreductase subunit L